MVDIMNEIRKGLPLLLLFVVSCSTEKVEGIYSEEGYETKDYRITLSGEVHVDNSRTHWEILDDDRNSLVFAWDNSVDEMKSFVFRDGLTVGFENGKAGIARNLKNGIGFGSTEYIVIRAKTDVVYPEWIFYHINTPDFINGGKNHMTGTAGQQRVDINYVKQYQIPVPSLEEQKRILDEIDAEKKLIESSRELVKVFEKKISDKVNNIWDN